MSMPGHTASKVNIGELLENSQIGPLQMRVFFLCMICLIMDGFDVQAMGYVAPAIVADWGIPRALLGGVFSAANFGVLIGSLVFSMVADKIGRRPVLIGATLFFSVMAIATAYAQNVQQLLWLRFIAGIGMGCIMPNATALIGEFSPKRSRVTLMMCITVGFTGGAALAGLVSLWMIPAFGWRSVFIFGGAVPLVIALLMIWGLPESLQFLAVSGRNRATLARWLKKLDPTMRIDTSTEFVANEERRSGVPAVHLFRDGRGITTVLIWVVNFMNLLVLYSISNWLPTVVTAMGYDAQIAVLDGLVAAVGRHDRHVRPRMAHRTGGIHADADGHFCRGNREHRSHRAARHLPAPPRHHRLRGGMGRHRRPARPQRALGHVLSHLPAFDRVRLGTRHWPHRLDRRPLHRGQAHRATVGSAGALLRDGGPGVDLDADDHRAVVHDEAAGSARPLATVRAGGALSSLTLVRCGRP